MNILNYLKTFVVVAVVAMAFTSCSKEQTSLSIDDIQGKARIKGTVTYCEGEEYKNGRYSDIIKAAANTPILVKISNASFKGGAYGYTTFETVTDANGDYEIEIPALEGGSNVRIQPQSFIGTYKEVTGMDYNSRPVYETVEGVFEAESSVTVSPNEIKFVDIEYDFYAR